MTREKVIAWLKAAGVRALKTVAQTAAATIGTAAVLGWLLCLSNRQRSNHLYQGSI